MNDPALTRSIQEAIAATFDEDAVVLKAQQRQLDVRCGKVPRVALRVDEAPMRARRLLDVLVQREADDASYAYRPVVMAEDGPPALLLCRQHVSTGSAR